MCAPRCLLPRVGGAGGRHGFPARFTRRRRLGASRPKYRSLDARQAAVDISHVPPQIVQDPLHAAPALIRAVHAGVQGRLCGAVPATRSRASGSRPTEDQAVHARHPFQVARQGRVAEPLFACLGELAIIHLRLLDRHPIRSRSPTPALACAVPHHLPVPVLVQLSTCFSMNATSASIACASNTALPGGLFLPVPIEALVPQCP